MPGRKTDPSALNASVYLSASLPHILCPSGVTMGPWSALCSPVPLSKGPFPSSSSPHCKFQVRVHPAHGLFLEPSNFSISQPPSPCSAAPVAGKGWCCYVSSGTHTSCVLGSESWGRRGSSTRGSAWKLVLQPKQVSSEPKG